MIRIEPAAGRLVPDDRGVIMTGPRTVRMSAYWARLIMSGVVQEIKDKGKKPAVKKSADKEV